MHIKYKLMGMARRTVKSRVSLGLVEDLGGVYFFYLILKAIQFSVLSCLFFKIFMTYC